MMPSFSTSPPCLKASTAELFFALLLVMALATLLPHVRTDKALLIGQICVAASVVGFSTTKTILANRAQTIHSQRGLMKRRFFVENSPKPKIEAMDT
jgi:hypothetical protein